MTVAADALPASVVACRVDAERVLARCAELAALSARSDGICRIYLSAEHARANELVGGWMRAAGMTVQVDAAGSLCGRYPAADAGAPALVVGSHLDTVPDAGRYDGILGVLLGVAAVERLARDGVRLPFHLDVIGFGEEEGVRFGTTLMTSRAFAGTWEPRWLALADADGVTLEAALRAFGLDPEAVPGAARDPADLLGFIEPHIEQGPVLEQRGLPLAVVGAIAGTRRFRARVTGRAGHAGTTPMGVRQDALAGAAEAVLLLERIASGAGVVATVGRLETRPGVANVIPGAAEFSIDIRAGDDARRDAALRDFVAELETALAARGLRLELEETHAAGAVALAPWLQRTLAAAVGGLGIEAPTLDSGAGHDAMAVAGACAAGMLFIRCAGGISHHPDEAVTADDTAWALAALERAIAAIGAEHADA